MISDDKMQQMNLIGCALFSGPIHKQGIIEDGPDPPSISVEEGPASQTTQESLPIL